MLLKLGKYRMPYVVGRVNICDAVAIRAYWDIEINTREFRVGWYASMGRLDPMLKRVAARELAWWIFFKPPKPDITLY